MSILTIKNNENILKKINVTKENNNNLMQLNKIIQEEINTYKFQNNYYLNENFLNFYNDNFINYIKNLKNTLFHSICDSIDLTHKILDIKKNIIENQNNINNIKKECNNIININKLNSFNEKKLHKIIEILNKQLCYLKNKENNLKLINESHNKKINENYEIMKGLKFTFNKIINNKKNEITNKNNFLKLNYIELNECKNNLNKIIENIINENKNIINISNEKKDEKNKIDFNLKKFQEEKEKLLIKLNEKMNESNLLDNHLKILNNILFNINNSKNFNEIIKNFNIIEIEEKNCLNKKITNLDLKLKSIEKGENEAIKKYNNNYEYYKNIINNKDKCINDLFYKIKNKIN